MRRSGRPRARERRPNLREGRAKKEELSFHGDGRRVGKSGDSRAAGAGMGNVSPGPGRRSLSLNDGACERLRERKRGCGEGCDPGQQRV